jgi:hypothetical protein
MTRERLIELVQQSKMHVTMEDGAFYIEHLEDLVELIEAETRATMEKE